MYGQKGHVLGATTVVSTTAWYMIGITAALAIIAIVLGVRAFFTLRSKKHRP